MPGYKDMESQARKYKRLHKGYLWAFIFAASAFVWQTFNVAAMNHRFDQQAMLHQAQTYAMSYALRSEQAKAGAFEAQRNTVKEKLGDNKGYVDNLLSRVASLEMMLEQCHATNRMLGGADWTGNAAITPGE